MAHSISEEKHYFIVFNESYNENQHCNGENCSYTFSHTAQWCGSPQSEFCECPYCYPNGTAEMLNQEMRATLASLLLDNFTQGLNSL